MQETNGALFLKGNFFSYASLFGSATVIVPLTKMYPLLESHKSDLSIGALNFICFLILYDPPD